MKKIILMLFIFINGLIFGKTYQKELFSQGTTVSGVTKEIKSYFFIEPNWDILKDPEIKLDMTASQLTLEDASTFTFIVNGKPIGSYKLEKDENNDKKLNLILNIPKGVLKVGANEFVLKKFQRLTRACNLDEVNPANWLKINDSILEIEYDKNNQKIDLGMLPMPILNIYPTTEVNTIRVGVNSKISPKDKIALANFALNLGSISNSNPNKIEVKTIDELKDTMGDYVIVSEFEKLPENLKATFNENDLAKLEKGRVFKLVENPVDSKSKILIYTGNEKEFGKNSVDYLDKNDLKFIVGDSFAVSSKNKEKSKFKITLTSLGIGEINFLEIGRSSQVFAIDLPKGKLINSLDFNIKYYASNLLNLNNSTLCISVNGKKIKDNIIKSDNLKGQFTVKIPASELQNSKVYIEVFANLITSRDCFTPPMPWLTILGESEFKYEARDEKIFNIGDFPAPFVKNNSLSSIGISVSPDKKSLGCFVEIFKMIGKNLDKTNKIFYILNNEDLKNVETAIIIGSPLTNNIIKNREKDLFLTYNSSETSFEKGKGIEFITENIYTGAQLLDKNQLYIFTDANGYYDNILKAIKDGDIKGDAYLAIGAKDGEAYYINTKEAKQIDENAYHGRVRLGLGILLGVMAIFAILAICFKKKKKKNDTV